MCINRQITKEPNYAVDPNVYEIDNPENAIFEITDRKLYVTTVTLSKKRWYKPFRRIKIRI